MQFSNLHGANTEKERKITAGIKADNSNPLSLGLQISSAMCGGLFSGEHILKTRFYKKLMNIDKCAVIDK